MIATRRFFDEMASRYDHDIREVGWDPVSLLQTWPFVVPTECEFLDAGCGTGALMEHVAGAGRTLAGFDLSPAMVARARRRRSLRDAELHVASAGEPWPFASARFHSVTMLAMLEFVERIDLAFDELQRVMRTGGRALVSVEDVCDWDGTRRPEREERYGRFPLWRRSLEDVEICLPPGLDVVTTSRVRAYTVIELGFTCAYWVLELERNARA